MNLSTYSDWSKIFDEIDTWEIGHVDENLMTSIENGKIEWLDGVAQRMTLRLTELINKRSNKLNAFYNKRLQASYNAFDISNLLITFRKELVFLKRISNIPILPDELKKNLTSEIISYANKTQKALEDSVKHDLSGEVKRVILSYKVNNI